MRAIRATLDVFDAHRVTVYLPEFLEAVASDRAFVV